MNIMQYFIEVIVGSSNIFEMNSFSKFAKFAQIGE